MQEDENALGLLYGLEKEEEIERQEVFLAEWGEERLLKCEMQHIYGLYPPT